MAGLGDDHFRHEQRYTSPVVLFDGRDLKNFDIFLTNRGLNNDPEQLFSCRKRSHCYLRQGVRLYHHQAGIQKLYLRAEFKWGEGTYAPRQGQARDNGILYHVQGPQKVSPTSIEFRIIEGGTGDLLDDRRRRVDGDQWCAGDGSCGKRP